VHIVDVPSVAQVEQSNRGSLITTDKRAPEATTTRYRGRLAAIFAILTRGTAPAASQQAIEAKVQILKDALVV
jgi:hypothetical protein